MSTVRITASEAAEVLECSRQHVHYLVKRGRLTVQDRVGTGRLVLLDRREVEHLKVERAGGKCA